MFFNKTKNLISELEREKAELQREVLRLKDALQNVQKTLAASHDSIANSEFVFDFTAVNVFSIERNRGSDLRPVTVISFMMPGATSPTEWYLYCSDEQHQKFVNAYKQNKKTK
jgi:trimethylamine:corrinoid methyltransferase-like protein